MVRGRETLYLRHTTSFMLPITHWQTTFHDSYSIPNSKFISTIFEEGTWRGARAPSWTLSGDYLGLLTPRTGRFWSCSMSLDTSRSIHVTMHIHIPLTLLVLEPCLEPLGLTAYRRPARIFVYVYVLLFITVHHLREALQPPQPP